jgi:LmbE family N-acetylglucosaminyl deacetylase
LFIYTSLASQICQTVILGEHWRIEPYLFMRKQAMPLSVIEILKNLRCRWRRWYFALRLPVHRVTADRLVLIAPHPDDETFGCGNIIALKKQQGARVKIIFLTDGEASMKGHSPIAPQEVANIRKEESVKACVCLGLSVDDLKRYSLPDGQVPRKGTAGFEEAVERLLNDIREFAPAEIICPHPMDGHGDHAAAAEMAQEALRRCKSPPRLLFYTVWFWFTAPWGIRKHLDFSSGWKIDGRVVHAQKVKAINTYLDHLEPTCGTPYCGKLHRSVIYCARQRSEILFEQHIPSSS